MRLRAIAALFLLAACAALPESGERDARVIVMGDSVMAWNRDGDASVADALEAQLGASVLDASVSGARMRLGGVGGAIGFSIPNQYRARDWHAVVFNGGANDLLFECRCNRCDSVLERLIAEDYPALLNRFGDTPVYIVGYYGPAGDRPGNYDICNDELQELERRLTRLVAARPNVRLVRVRDAITGNPALYDADRVHPSPAGSARIAERIVAALSR